MGCVNAIGKLGQAQRQHDKAHQSVGHQFSYSARLASTVNRPAQKLPAKFRLVYQSHGPEPACTGAQTVAKSPARNAARSRAREERAQR